MLKQSLCLTAVRAALLIQVLLNKQLADVILQWTILVISAARIRFIHIVYIYTYARIRFTHIVDMQELDSKWGDNVEVQQLKMMTTLRYTFQLGLKTKKFSKKIRFRSIVMYKMSCKNSSV